MRDVLLSPQFTDPANCLRALLLAGRSSSSARSRKSAGPASRSNDALTPLVEHGAAAVRAAGRRRLGARAGLVLDRRDAGADELRVAARGQPEVQPARRRARRDGRRREALLSLDARSADAGAVRTRRRTQALLDYLRAGGAWTGSGRAAARQGRRASRTSSSARASISSFRRTTMTITRREFVRGGVAAFTVSFAAPEFLSRPRARAGRVAPQPRRRCT